MTISKEISTVIKGFCILVIICSHVFSGMDFSSGVDFLRIILPSNISFFIFSSGYGLAYQHNKHGDKYLDHFVSKKIVIKLMIPYLISLGLYTIVLLCAGLPLNFKISEGHPYMSNAWYMYFILIVYFAFFLIYKIFKQSSQTKKIIYMSIFIIIYMLVCIIIKFPMTWYGNALAFILGMIVAKVNSDKLKWFDKKISIVIVFLIMQIFNCLMFHLVNFPLSGMVGYFGVGIFQSLFFAMLCRYKIAFPLRILTWLGNKSLYLYLFHSVILRVIIANCDSVPIATVLCLGGAVIMTIIYDFIVKIFHKLFPKKKQIIHSQ